MGKKQRSKREAATADKYRLYQDAVQDTESDIALAERVFKQEYGRMPRLLREDFSGTSLMACDWVTRHADNHAWAIDLDPEPLAWGREHNLASLSPDQAKRIELVEADVLDAECGPVDICVAFNFSYFLFKTREEMLRYVTKARSTLRDEGVFMVDVYGGAEAQTTMTETREQDDFDYVWDQDIFDPISHDVVNYIHFEFEDGSGMRKAFRYDWRLWSLPELRDLMKEAGFRETRVYWEGTDTKTNEGNGIFRRAEHAPDDPAWIAYIVAIP